ncbi:hypothetical protein DSAG12_03253 [Promethearchaeum syntrophicum]|uniref:Uncharacterized protein n=1 Tax=Promethearchaeum syntrophicum TaxID=2594042 RepID=A0A5B9DFB4_9ARCH|nr:hypothetical protein [Candidatus Prometheoarchaeum syntrophicum]QEE17416.1 hypothetical protein DSAG12_03253 [Candidatus Prometheoarchaeum syntrophicum]
MNWKRFFFSIPLGMLMGVFCIIGLSQRIPTGGVDPSNSIYLWGAWYERVIMGVMIGFAGELVIFKSKRNLFNAFLRGAILGLFTSAGFAFFQQFIDLTFFLTGIIFGGIIDIIATFVSRDKID